MSELRAMGQKELQETFRVAFRRATTSNNNQWLDAGSPARSASRRRAALAARAAARARRGARPARPPARA